MEGGSPVKDFHAGRDGNEKAEKRESEAGIDGLAGDEHVMAPDQEAEYGNRDAGVSDEVIAEDSFARETGDGLADDTHAGQDHDVNSRVGIEPEQVLKKDGVAAEFWIEKAEAPDS